MKTLGCIGCGNMGSAILKGLEHKKELQCIGFDFNDERLTELAKNFSFSACASPQDVAKEAEYLLLGVKPQQVVPLLEELRPHLSSRTIVLSIAAGVTVAALQKAVDGICPVVRIMPNTPAMVGEGIYALCFADPLLTETMQTNVERLFGGMGKALVLDEEKFNAFTAIAGCGPAYVFHMMEAVTEAAVTVGFTRQEATDMVVKLFKGSVKLADETDTHLSVLREMVCSPAGVTIEAVNHLDRTAVRGHIIDAVLAAYSKGEKMTK